FHSPRDFTTDFAESYNAADLSGQTAPGRKRLFRPLAGAHVTFRFSHAPHDHHDESQRDVRDRHGNRIRNVGHRDSAAPRRRHIDLRETLAETRDDLDLRHRVDLACAHTVHDGGNHAAQAWTDRFD